MADKLQRPEHYGSASGLNPQNFPDCVVPDYFEEWAQYCATKTAYDLYNRAPEPYGMTLAIFGFLSSLASTKSKFLLKSVKTPMQESIRMFDVYLKSIRKDNDYALTRNLFLSKFQPADVNVTLSSDLNKVANVLTVSAQVYITYVPKPERGRIPKIGSVLHIFKTSWFKGKEPEQVFKTDNLTQKLAKSPIPNVPDTYPQVRQLIGRTSLWYPWLEKLGIDVARVRGNAIALKFDVPQTLIFLDTVNKSKMEKLLIKKIKKTFL